MLKKSVTSLLALLLIGCASSTTVIAPECFFARVIMISDEDVLTEGTADQILEHNMNTEDICS